MTRFNVGDIVHEVGDEHPSTAEMRVIDPPEGVTPLDGYCALADNRVPMSEAWLMWVKPERLAAGPRP